MTSAMPFAAINQEPRPLGIPGVEEPALVQYEAQVWSCRERKEIPARLYYAVTSERNWKTYRLLFIEPLI